MTIEFNPKQETKERYLLAEVPMPASPDLREGERNVLHLSVAYYKRGFGRQGRGFYLTATGCSTDGVIQRHALMADPAEYVLVAPAKRFSAKALRELVASVPETQTELIEKLVGAARDYYASKGEAA
jgi:hypothetical protein